MEVRMGQIFANRDQPDAWNRAVLEFLARCDGRRKGAA
jgi:hypothetical protein